MARMVKRRTWLMLLTALLGAGVVVPTVVWVRDHSIWPSDLRVRIEQPEQLGTLSGDQQPEINGSPLFCDTVKFRLVISHNFNGNVPITVDKISVKTNEIDLGHSKQAAQCRIDPLSLHPFGIEQRNTYNVWIRQRDITATFIVNEKAGQAYKVTSDNILDTKLRHSNLSFLATDPPWVVDVNVSMHADKYVQLWFEVLYDADGPKKRLSNSILLAPRVVDLP